MPGLTVVTAFLLVVVSIAVLVVYVHHIGRSLRVSALIEIVGKDTRHLLDSMYRDVDDGPGRASDSSVIHATRSGVLCHVDFERLVATARDADCTLELVPAFGEFVAAGAPLLTVDGDGSRLPENVSAAVVLGLERTLEQDVAYGLRLLVDMPSAPWPTLHSSTPPPQCRRSIVSTTVFDISPTERFPTGCTGTTTAA